MIGVRIEPGHAVTTYLYTRATVAADGTVILLPCDAIVSTDLLRSRQQSGQGTSTLTFTALDASGAAMASEPASFDAPSCDAWGQGTAVVSLFLPVDPKRLPVAVTASLEGKQASTLKLPPPTPGDLKFTDSPAQDELVAGVRAIAWMSESRDPSDERHSVWYTADGIAWIPLDFNVLDGRMTVDFDSLPGSKQAQLRIAAARGAAVSETRTPTFVVSTPPIRVTVTRPAGTVVVAPGQPVRVEARASRPAGGPVADPTAYTWSSDLDGPLGTGWACSLRLKQTGMHVLSVAVSQDGDLVTEPAPAKVTVTRPVTSFVHTPSAENTVGSATRLAHTPTAAERTSLVQVTCLCRPRDTGGGADPQAVAVRYADGVWEIVRLDGQDIFQGSAFVVDFSDPGPTTFTHLSSSDGGEAAPVKHQLLHANPGALLLVTPVQPPYTPPAPPPSTEPIAADLREGRWRIRSQSAAEIATGSAFNLEALIPGAQAFLHIATSRNIRENATYLDHPAVNEQPAALVQISARVDSGASRVRNPYPTGVWYDPGQQRWVIVNPGKTAMPEGATFTVAVSHADQH
jgi:hypothetical protein